MKKKFLILIIFISLILLLLVSLVFVTTYNLKIQLTQAKDRLKKIQAEMVQLQADKENMAEDNKKLKAEIISYVASNRQFQDKQDKLQQTIEEMAKTIKVKEGELKILKQGIEKLEEFKKKNKDAQTQQNKFFLRERDSLSKKVSSLEATLKKERALYHYNLGVAYSQMKFYAEAIKEYEKSLMFNSHNADAHYNLGFLYTNFQPKPVKAKEHYRKYLELKPNAEDRAEVENWIKIIQEVN